MAKAERVLALLEALQDGPSATGPSLARRLGVDVRTVRRDVVSLRDLGIPVEAERGPGGCYRLRPGFRVPPLMFTAPEAAAAALGLVAARRLGLDADGALAKLRRVLPTRVRGQVEALEHALGFTGAAPAPAPPDGETLLALADAAWRSRRIHARYTDSGGVTSARELSPYGVVSHAGRWYVPGFDHTRDALRALRADRFADVRVGGTANPAPPGFEPIAFVSRSLARVPWTHQIEVLLHTPPATAVRHFPPTLAELEPDGEHTFLRMRADSLDWAAALLAGAGCDFTIRHPEALRTAVHELAARLSGV